MTPRDSESVLDQLEATLKIAQEAEDIPTWDGAMIDFSEFWFEHAQALLDVARAAVAMPHKTERLYEALAPLTPPSEQKEET